MRKKLYREIAGLVDARLRCEQRGNTDWFDKHGDRLDSIARDLLPSGSGFDSGTTIDLDRSTGERLVFCTSFHHMNEHGMYDGWTEHTVIVTPSLISGFDLRVTGRERYRGGDWKDYCAETFQYVLDQDCELIKGDSDYFVQIAS